MSRALNRPEQVAPATRERVEAVVDEMGFVPNRAARGLITGRTGNVAVIVPDITNPHFAALVRAAERAAREAELQLLLVDTGEHAEEEVRAARTPGQRGRRLRRRSRPAACTATLGCPGLDPGGVRRTGRCQGRASVVMRTAPAIDEAVRHLAVARPPPRWPTSAGRRRRGRRASGADAVRRTGEATGMEVHRGRRSGQPTFEAGRRGRRRHPGLGATAVVAFNDQMALGVIAGLARSGHLGARRHERGRLRRRADGGHDRAAAHDDPHADRRGRRGRRAAARTAAGTATTSSWSAELVVRGSTGAGQSLRSSRQRRRRWWAAAFGRRSRVNTPFLLPSTRMKD